MPTPLRKRLARNCGSWLKGDTRFARLSVINRAPATASGSGENNAVVDAGQPDPHTGRRAATTAVQLGGVPPPPHPARRERVAEMGGVPGPALARRGGLA